MGKGDRKTAKGKRTIGTYGNSRRKKRNEKNMVYDFYNMTYFRHLYSKIICGNLFVIIRI